MIAYGKRVVSLVIDVLIGRRIYLSVHFSKITGGADDGRVRAPEGQPVVENVVCGHQSRMGVSCRIIRRILS